MEKNVIDMDFLITLLLNNARLDYDGKDLRLDGDEIVLAVIKVLAEEKYEKRLKELQEKENEED